MGAAAKASGKANDSIGERIAENDNRVVTTRFIWAVCGRKVARWQARAVRQQHAGNGPLARVASAHQRSVVSGLNNKYPSPAQAVRIQLCGVRVCGTVEASYMYRYR